MKSYIYLSFILVSMSGLLLSCNGQQRPLDNSPVETVSPAETATGNTQTNNEGATTGGPNPPEGPPPQPISFEKDIKPLFETHCITCHVPGAPPTMPSINWLDYTIAKSYADNGVLKERVWDLRGDPTKGMPFANGTQMTEDERKQIVKWIENGGLQ